MTKFGREITRGCSIWPEGMERPVWLADDFMPMQYQTSSSRTWHDMQWGWGFGVVGGAIRLPADHFAYTVLDWNDSHPDQPPFMPWQGGESAPDDWNGGEVLRRCGSVCEGKGDWLHAYGSADYIGYRPRTTAKPDSDTVTIKRRTWEEWSRFNAMHATRHMAFGALGLIKPEPIEAERIAALPGVELTPEQVQRVLDAAKQK